MDFSALFKKKANPKEYYFGLFLRSDSAVGFIFEIIDGNASLVAKEVATYSNGWEGIIDDIDELLAVLENETGIHVGKTIFFVYSYFIDQASGEIKEPYKKVIKSLSKELELQPMGYIECHEAVKNMLEKKDLSPFSGVFVELDTSHVCVYVCKGGKFIYNEGIPRTDSLVDDIMELFSKKKDQYLLPSRVIMYGSTPLEKEAALLREFAWAEDLFIQSPRIHTIKSEELLNGLGDTFMTQIEQQNGLKNDDEEAIMHNEIKEDLPAEEPAAPARAAVPPPVVPSVAAPATAAAALDMPATKKEPEVQVDDEPDEADKMGFVVGGDVTEMDEIAPPAKPEKSAKKGIKMPQIGSTLQSMSFTMPSMKMPTINIKAGKKGVLISITALLVLMALGAVEFFFHRAVIAVELPSEAVSDKYNLAAPISGSIDSRLAVAKKTIKTEIKDSIETSGQREVGEKAKGEVVIHNFDDKPVNISKGTTIEVDGKKFTLDSDVNVASASEKTVGTKEAGKKNVSATAAEIGSEYNIEKGKRMAIAGLSSSNYYAIVESAFSGGSKKELQTVAKVDLDTLEEQILKEGKQKSNTEIKAKLKENEKLLNNLTDVSIGDSEYSGEVGEEASKVSVTAQVNITYYVYNEEQLHAELINNLKKEVPSGYDIEKSDVSYKLNDADMTNNQVKLAVLGEATAVKRVDKDKIITRIRGKSANAAMQIIQDEFDAENVTIESNSSPLLVFNSLIPFHLRNIQLELK